MTLLALDEKRVVEALLRHRRNFDGSDQRFAEIYDLHPSQFSQLKQGKVQGVISSDKMVEIGMRLNVSLVDAPEWKIVKTKAYEEYTELMRICQEEGAARIICDKADRGKTTAAKEYMLRNKNVFYVDCSMAKTYRLFIRALAKSMGISTNNKMEDIFQMIIRMLVVTRNPLVMLDEFGDLSYDAFLSIKALWNGTECRCGWVVIGAQGLRKKLDSGIRNERVGFEEFFRRFGTDYLTAATIHSDVEERMFFMSEADKIVKGNMPGMKVSELISKNSDQANIMSLTRIKERIVKMKREGVNVAA